MPQFYEFPLIKSTATGNDFLLADLLDSRAAALWQREFGSQPRAHWVKQWCDRYTGLGADGLVVLEPESGLDFKWDFYNSDGGGAEMCGNAARAVSLYVSEKLGRDHLKFRTSAGVIEARVHSPADIEVRLPKIKSAEWGEDFDFVVAGVPHAVVRVTSLEDTAALTRRALEIRALGRFRPAGTNVTFMRPLDPRHIEAKTFERGVDGFTKSCGTGAVAAAHALLRGTENQPVDVDVPGGRLNVVWKEGEPVLRGPARIVGEMRWARED